MVVPPQVASLSARVDELERQLRDLRARVAAIEKALGTRLEHPVDRDAVRDKVTYDWQA